MDMIKMLRRFPMAFAPLAMLLSPIGCGSDSPSTPVAESPAVPTVVDGAPASLPAPVASIDPAPAAPEPMPSVEMPSNVDHATRTLDREVRKTSGEVKDEVRDAKGELKKAIEDAKEQAEGRTKALGNDARKAAEQAVDNLLGDPK